MAMRKKEPLVLPLVQTLDTISTVERIKGPRVFSFGTIVNQSGGLYTRRNVRAESLSGLYVTTTALEYN